MTVEEAKKELEKFKKITFYEEPHIYTYQEEDGNESKFGISVTTLVGEYEQPFNEDEMAEIVSRKNHIPKQDVLDMWRYERDFACCKGTHTHAYNENLWGGKEEYQYDRDAVIKEFGYDNIAPVWEKLKKICDKFYEKYHDRIIPVGLEQYVGSKDYDVCGAIDFLAYSIKLKSFIIIDYKTNKEIKEKSYGEKTMLYPLDNLPDCNFYHYSLQLAIYKYLIEYETNIKINPKKWLIWINEKNDDFVLYECVNLDNEAQKILEKRRKEITCPF